MDLFTYALRTLEALLLGSIGWHCWRARRYNGPFVRHVAWVFLTVSFAMWWYLIVGGLETWGPLPREQVLPLRGWRSSVVWGPCLWCSLRLYWHLLHLQPPRI